MEFMRINHVGFRVSDMDASVRFYQEVLGLREVDAFPDRSFVALSWGTELHDVALILDGAAAGGQSGVHHVAITLAGGTEELRAFAARAAAWGATIEMAVDHLVTRSVYVLDPDGNRSLTPSGEPQLSVYPSIKFSGNFGELSLDQGNDGSNVIRDWISNGVPAFQKPKSKNAATTLALLGGIAVSMFAGVTALALAAHVHVADTASGISLTGVPAGQGAP